MFAVSAALGVTVLAGAAVWTGRARPLPPPPSQPADARPQEGQFAERTKGSATAPITIYEVADFQCPACRMFWEETMPQLEREYVTSGKVRLIFVHLPLQEIHPNAAAAHQFAMCAADQGRFWPVHDRLFGEQDAWARLDDPSPVFLAMATAVGLARDTLDACLVDEGVKERLVQERESVLRAGVRSTPSFIIRAGAEQGLFPGAAPIEAWRPVLDSLFAVVTVGRAVGR